MVFLIFFVLVVFQVDPVLWRPRKEISKIIVANDWGLRWWFVFG